MRDIGFPAWVNNWLEFLDPSFCSRGPPRSCEESKRDRSEWPTVSKTDPMDGVPPKMLKGVS